MIYKEKFQSLWEQTNLVNYNSADELLTEVLTILRLIIPTFRTTQVRLVYEVCRQLYHGEYPGYQACNTRYHDFNHAIHTFLALARLIHGAAIAGKTFTPKQINLALTAALFHDAGFIQEASDQDGTGAKHLANHVTRSIQFWQKHGPQHGFTLDDIENISTLIEVTDLSFNLDTIRQGNPIGELAIYLVAADLWGQLADRIYLEKLLFLFHEFKEGSIDDFTSEIDVLRKTEYFYDSVDERLSPIENELDNYLRLHFSARWGLDENVYIGAIARQKEYLQGILNIPDSDPRDYLKRDGLVEEVRSQYSG